MEELAFIERLQSELGSKNIACAIAFFFAMFDEEKGDFDLSYSKNFIRTKNGKFKEENTSSFNIKFEKEFEEYLRKKRLPEEVIKSALKKRFGFLRIFYLPPKYLKEPVCLISGKAKKFSDVSCFVFSEDIKDFRNRVEKFLKWLGFEENFDKYKKEDFEYVYFYYTKKLREWLEISPNEVLYIYHIPFFKELGVGGIEFAINECLMREQIEEIRRLALPFFIDRLSLEIYRYEGFNLTHYALRSAVAAIMSRNMSHNIGSHVLAYLKMEKLVELAVRLVLKENNNYVKGIKELIKEISKYQSAIQNFACEIQCLSNFQNNNEIESKTEEFQRKLIKEKNEIDEILNKLTGGSIRWGLAEWARDTQNFFGYLQHRMDFLAQVSTEWPEWTFSAYLMKDIMREFLSQRHLLDGIAKSEGLRGFYYDWEIGHKNYLDCKKLTGEKVEEYGKIKFHVLNLGKIGDRNESEEWDYDLENLCNSVSDRINKFKNKEKKLRTTENKEKYLRILLNSDEKGDIEPNIDEGDIQIAIPGGIIGYHAFYVIIENVIRNSAKHSYTKQKNEIKDLEIVIEFRDDIQKPDELWLFRIYDNVSFAHKGEGTISVSPEENEEGYLLKWERKNDNLTYKISKIKNGKEENIYENTISIKNGEIEVQSDDLNDKIREQIKEKLEKLLNVLRKMLYDEKRKMKKLRIFSENNIEKEWKTPEFDLVAFMNECLRHSIIKETGELGKKHWGMAEMKIAAGYLQGREIQDIGAEGDKITGSEKNQNADKEDFIIRAIESPIGTLGFEFKVRKPKEVGILCTKAKEA